MRTKHKPRRVRRGTLAVADNRVDSLNDPESLERARHRAKRQGMVDQALKTRLGAGHPLFIRVQRAAIRDLEHKFKFRKRDWETWSRRRCVFEPGKGPLYALKPDGTAVWTQGRKAQEWGDDALPFDSIGRYLLETLSSATLCRASLKTLGDKLTVDDLNEVWALASSAYAAGVALTRYEVQADEPPKGRPGKLDEEIQAAFRSRGNRNQEDVARGLGLTGRQFRNRCKAMDLVWKPRSAKRI